jgi:hypothetical protein
MPRFLSILLLMAALGLAGVDVFGRRTPPPTPTPGDDKGNVHTYDDTTGFPPKP